MSEPFIGEILMFAGNFAPSGWFQCNGQLVPIASYQALFAILGTNFGGNGTNNFALPDFRGRVPVNWGQGPGLSNYVLGEQTGTENVTLLSTQMPQHNHLVNCNSAAAARGGTNPSNNYPAGVGVNPTTTTVDIYSGSAGATMNQQMIRPAGGSQPHDNLQPLLAVTFIIAFNGVFPVRN